MSINEKIHNPDIKFRWHRIPRKVGLSVAGGDISMSKPLLDLLGFKQSNPYEIGEHVAVDSFDVNASMHLLYVYCDVASYTPVGESKVPLLRVCNSSGDYGEIIRQTYTHPHYVAVSRRDIETIEVNINNELGKPMPFEFGKTVVTLHFRRLNQLI
jgi:hypothetical protein